VYLKLENLQVTGSFKYRGALNSMFWARENGIRDLYGIGRQSRMGIAEAAVATEREVTVCLPLRPHPEKTEIEGLQHRIDRTRRRDRCN